MAAVIFPALGKADDYGSLEGSGVMGRVASAPSQAPVPLPTPPRSALAPMPTNCPLGEEPGDGSADLVGQIVLLASLK